MFCRVRSIGDWVESGDRSESPGVVTETGLPIGGALCPVGAFLGVPACSFFTVSLALACDVLRCIAVFACANCGFLRFSRHSRATRVFAHRLAAVISMMLFWALGVSLSRAILLFLRLLLLDVFRESGSVALKPSRIAGLYSLNKRRYSLTFIFGFFVLVFLVARLDRLGVNCR